METNKFWKPVLLIAVSAAMLLFVFASGNSAKANSYNTVYPTFLSTGAASANDSITNIFNIVAPDSFPLGGTLSGIPKEFLDTNLDGTADVGVGIPNGSITGVLISQINFGLPFFGINACFAPAVLPFHLVAANSDPSGATGLVTGSSNDKPTNVWPGYRDGPSNGGSETTTNGLPDAVDSWPTLLDAELVKAGNPTLVSRSYAQLNVTGTIIPLHFLIYAPGTVPGLPASLGYISQSVLQDPNAAPAPSLIGDTCTDPVGPFTTTITLGVTAGEPAYFPLPPCSATSCSAPLPLAGSMFHPFAPPNLPFGEVCDGADNDGDTIIDEGCGFLNRENPAAAGSYLFSITSVSDRDADNDGISNENDACPRIVDAEPSGPFAPFPAGAGYNDRFPGPQTQDIDFDGLSGSLAIPSCDPSPTVPSPSLSGVGPDQDSDFFSNLQDNCPLLPNFSQAQGELFPAPAPLDGGPFSDTQGDPCDPNPTVSDGHFHQLITPFSVCVGLTDSDFDGYCDADEIALGSDPGNPFSQPEDITGLAPGLLTLGMVCSDGVDNDGVGGTDLADAKCQLPKHDLKIANPTGARRIAPVVGSPLTRDYRVTIKNKELDAETAHFAVLVDSLAGCGGARVLDIFKSGGAGSVVSVDLGQGGQVNNDTGGFPGPSGPIGSAVTDIEPEGAGLATLALDAGTLTDPSKLTVKVTVEFTNQFDLCALGDGVTDATRFDYSLSVDVCHSGDPSPLGLFSTGPCQGSPVRAHPITNDGGQDRGANAVNDAARTITINDTNR